MILTDELFDRLLPLPFRVIFLLNFGCWLWYGVLLLVERAHLNLSVLLKFPQQQSFIKNYQVTTEYISIGSVLSYLVYCIFINKAEETIGLIDFIPLFTIIFIFWSLSNRFKSTFKRVLTLRIDLSIRTNDILLSDSLLSYNKIAVDLLIYLLHLFNLKTTYQIDNKIMINRSFGEFWNLGHLVLLYPVVIRLSQCFYEYKLNDNKTQLWNFGKYLTNALIIFVSLITERSEIIFTLQLINAVYSFIWDLTIDWEFNLLKNIYFKKFSNPNLRSNLKLFDNSSVYYLIISINFLIRFNWILRYMDIGFLNLEIGLFTLQFLEVFRRFMWILLKLDVDFSKLNEFELTTYHES